jgi:hypothetical protein
MWAVARTLFDSVLRAVKVSREKVELFYVNPLKAGLVHHPNPDISPIN